MTRITLLIKGGLLIGFALSGLFLIKIIPVQASARIQDIQIAVEQYAAQQHATASAAFTINPPIVVEVADDGVSDRQKPLIRGLAPNDTILRIYIDDVFAGSIPIRAQDEHAVIFNYQPNWLLARQTHSVYVIAVNKSGVLSKPSNRMYFTIKNLLVPQISATRIEANDAISSSSAIVNPIIDFNNYQPPLQQPLLQKTGFTKEFILFLILIEVLIAWVWFQSDNSAN